MQKPAPKPQKRSADGQKPHSTPQNRAHPCVKPEQSAAGIEQIPQRTGQKNKDENQIPQPSQLFLQPPKTPQQIIDCAKTQSQQNGYQKFQTLDGNRQFHQPNRRAKKPPASRLPSS